MLTLTDKLFRNAGYRCKLVRVSRGQSHGTASTITCVHEKLLCRMESGMEKSDMDTLVKVIEGQHISYAGVFKHYDTIPGHAQRKHIDFLGVQLGYFLRRKDIRYLSDQEKCEAWKKELERLGGLTDEERSVLAEVEGG